MPTQLNFDHVDIDWPSVIRPIKLEPFRVHKSLNPHVATLRLFPGITTSSVQAFLSSPLLGVGAYPAESGRAKSERHR